MEPVPSRRFLLVLTFVLSLLPGVNAGAQSVPVQSLFLGDRSCPDTPEGCTFDGVTAEHRYLHVIVHDEPHTYQWKVYAGSDCSDVSVVAADGEIPDSGFLEVVVDLQGIAWGKSGCYVLRGDEGFATTFYAAYIDETASPDGAAIYPSYQSLGGRPDLPDLDVASIARTPALPYDAVPNAPRAGQRVHFHASVVNSGALPSGAFYYRWAIDGRSVTTQSYVSAIAPGQSVSLTLTWRWDPAPHTVSLRIFPGEAEISQLNDQLSVRTDALALGFWVEQGVYSYFRDHQWAYCQEFSCNGSDSFEDWLQRQVQAWNGILGAARDRELAPAGVADRIRVQKIVIVPDGRLPVDGFAATNAPDLSDHSVDLEWGLQTQGIDQQMNLNQDGGFDVDWALIHELGHARYLGDLYRFDVPLGKDTSVDVTATDGRAAFNASDPLDPGRPLVAFHGERTSLYLYRNKEADMMSCDCNHFYSPYDAAVLNRIQGRRARCGNANPPCNLGEWFAEIPPDNRLKVVDEGGSPVQDGSAVKLFFDTSTVYNGHSFDDAHSQTLHTRSGLVNLPANPFAVNGPTQMGHNVLLIDVVVGGADHFCFEEPTDFNIAFWEGYREAAHPATYTLGVQPRPGNACNLQRPPAVVNEPFATSPFASHVALTVSGKTVRASVTLVDGATPANPVKNREIAFRDRAGKIVARVTTGERGSASVSMAASDPPTAALDVTDNDLVIPVRSAPAPGSSAPRP